MECEISVFVLRVYDYTVAAEDQIETEFVLFVTLYGIYSTVFSYMLLIRQDLLACHDLFNELSLEKGQKMFNLKD